MKRTAMRALRVAVAMAVVGVAAAAGRGGCGPTTEPAVRLSHAVAG